MPVLACRVDTATSGRATVVIAEPNPLTDSPTQNKPKFRVRSRPPTGLRLAAGMRSAAASGPAFMTQATLSLGWIGLRSPGCDRLESRAQVRYRMGCRGRCQLLVTGSMRPPAEAGDARFSEM
jgi:hypothetical protein